MTLENEPHRDRAGAGGPSGLALFGQFALIPLVIVVIGVSVFILFGLIADGRRSPDHYLDEIRNGSAGRRWQAAWELSRELRQGNSPQDPELVPHIVSTLEWARDEDPQVRRYLVRALGYLADRRAVPPLIEALDDRDLETRLWAAEALGAVGDPLAVAPLIGLLHDSDRDLRKQAAHSLGSLAGAGEGPAAAALRMALQDPVADVRWNAALALARLGLTDGSGVLHDMLHRGRIEAVPGIRPDQAEAAMVYAAMALGELRVDEARADLDRLSREDPSLRVRQAALTALRRLEVPDR